MFKKGALLIWVFLLLGSLSAAQQGEGLIKEIFLIKNPNKTYVTAPLEIRIGIDMASPAYYKLSNEDTFLSAGFLPKGVNYLSIPTKSFFEKTAKHSFLLELKTEEAVTRKDIVLDIQLAIMEAPKKTEPEPEIPDQKLTLYIENQLVSTRIKQQEMIPSIQKDLASVPRNTDPFFVPKEKDALMRNTISIIDALLMSYQLIRSVTKKKDKGDLNLSLQHTHSLTIKFFKRNSRGVEEEVIAMIGLTTKKGD